MSLPISFRFTSLSFTVWSQHKKHLRWCSVHDRYRWSTLSQSPQTLWGGCSSWTPVSGPTWWLAVLGLCCRLPSGHSSRSSCRISWQYVDHWERKVANSRSGALDTIIVLRTLSCPIHYAILYNRNNHSRIHDMTWHWLAQWYRYLSIVSHLRLVQFSIPLD